MSLLRYYSNQYTTRIMAYSPFEKIIRLLSLDHAVYEKRHLLWLQHIFLPEKTLKNSPEVAPLEFEVNRLISKFRTEVRTFERAGRVEVKVEVWVRYRGISLWSLWREYICEFEINFSCITELVKCCITSFGGNSQHILCFYIRVYPLRPNRMISSKCPLKRYKKTGNDFISVLRNSPEAFELCHHTKLNREGGKQST